jgi:hypothetical protein
MLDKTSAIVSVALATLSLARPAQAQEPEPDAAAPAAAGGDGADQLTLPKGRLLLDAFFEMALSSGAVFKPFSLTPDIWYGATDDITVGLIHSGLGRTGFIGGVGDALCLAGENNGCPSFFPGFGIDARYRFKTGAMPVVVGGGLYVRDFNPFQLAIKIGAVGRWRSGKIAVEFAPNLFFGVTNRAPEVMGVASGETNQEVFHLPVTALYEVTPQISAALQTGLVLPFQATGDTYRVPLSIGGHYHLNESVNLSLAFSLLQLIGGGSSTGFDVRTLTLGGTYAF